MFRARYLWPVLVIGGAFAPALAADAPVKPMVLDDPMLPPGEEPVTAVGKKGNGAKRPVRERFHLSAIRVDRNQPSSAIINGRRVKVGSPMCWNWCCTTVS